MKAIIAAIVLTFAVVPSHADTNLLLNGDFKNGTDKWEGDFHALVKDDRSTTGLVDLSNGAAGVITDLGGTGSNWYGLIQPFQAKGTAFDYTITYQLSDDCQSKESVPAADPSAPPIDLTDVYSYMWSFLVHRLGVNPPVKIGDDPSTPSGLPASKGSDFILVVYDKASGTSGASLIRPTLGSIAPQTSTGTISLPEGNDRIFFLIFRQGIGKVMLYHAGLAPSSSPAAAAPLLDRSATLPQMHL